MLLHKISSINDYARELWANINKTHPIRCYTLRLMFSKMMCVYKAKV